MVGWRTQESKSSRRPESKTLRFREALRKLDFLLGIVQLRQRETEFLAYLFSLLREAYSDMNRDEIRELPIAAYRRPGMQPLDQKLTQQDIQDLVSTIQRHYELQIDSMTRQMDAETVMATKEILTKRKEVLTRRRDFIIRLRDVRAVNLRHQMELIAETFEID